MKENFNRRKFSNMYFDQCYKRNWKTKKNNN